MADSQGQPPPSSSLLASSHNSISESSTATSTTTSSASRSNNVISNEAEPSLMLPLSVGDFPALQGLQFLSSSAGASSSGVGSSQTGDISGTELDSSGASPLNINLNEASALVVNTSVARGTSHAYPMDSSTGLAGTSCQTENVLSSSNNGRFVTDHSNEVSSNGVLNDSQLQTVQQVLCQSNLEAQHQHEHNVTHQVGVGGNDIPNSSVSVAQDLGHIIGGNSASAIIQALGASLNRVVTGNNLPSLITLNQSGIVSGNDIIAVNPVSSGFLNVNAGQLLTNPSQQQLLQQHHSLSNTMDGVEAGPSEGVSEARSSSNNSGSSRRNENDEISLESSSASLNQAALSNRPLVAVSLSSNSSQGQHIWIQPDQSSFPSNSVNLDNPSAVQGSAMRTMNVPESSQNMASLRGASSSTSGASSSGQGQVSSMPGREQDHIAGSSRMETQQAHLVHDGHFHGLHVQYPGLLQVQQDSEAFQAAVHSTYGRGSSTSTSSSDFHRQQPNDGQAGDSEAMPSLPNIHRQHQVSTSSASSSTSSRLVGHQVSTMPQVDSSTLHQSYSLVYDAENNVLTVQQVMSPSDCTVSQSAMNLDSSEAQPNRTSSLERDFSRAGTSGTSEVSTSSLSSAILEVNSERVNRSRVNVLQQPLSRDDGASSSSQSGMVTPKLERSDLDDVPECDTTQEDMDFQDEDEENSQSYMHPSTSGTNNIDSHMGLDTPGLHSTVDTQRPGLSATGGVIMDSTLDSSELNPLHAVAMETGSRDEQVALQESVSEEDHLVQSSGSMDMNEPVPGPSGLYVNVKREIVADSTSRKNKSLRKSRRLELNEQIPTASQRKLEYKLQEYDPNMHWCDECMMTFVEPCAAHRLCQVSDKVVQTRAFASCPPHVQIVRLPAGEMEEGESAFGVQAKRPLPKFTQFGPFCGELVDSMDKVVRNVFPLMVEGSDGSRQYFETTDEEKCNWMMFVRPAKTFAEQNCVAYQLGQDIYFTVTRLIENKQELKVWYAAHYAQRMGVQTLELTEADVQALDEEDAKYPCFECSRKFKTSAALSQHLVFHDEEGENLDLPVDDGEEDFSDTSASRSSNKRKATVIRGRLVRGKNRDANGELQWKKKSNAYLQRTLKKYKRRGQADKNLQTMKSMYKKQGKSSGGNEWVCTHCGLTFDNASLLNFHTLTHAADLGLDEAQRVGMDSNGESQTIQLNGEYSNMSEGAEVKVDQSMLTFDSVTSLTCPKCLLEFPTQKELLDHIETHAQQPKRTERPYDCSYCSKSFSTQEKLLRHELIHGDDSSKPLECPVCQKRVMNNSAMACHMKKHSDKKYYDCPVCGEDFAVAAALREHSLKHVDSFGRFPCTVCNRSFEEFSLLKKHMKTFHSDKAFQCPECSKIFPRLDKLRLHSLRHTSHREFMCETCGKQFKRKDKLKEHMGRMHTKERMAKQLPAKLTIVEHKKFVPKVVPTDYHRFIYKCHTCLLGFKRRGMLVNHLAKRHPEIKPEQVPELNLPILKTQKDFYCQYCDKIYKSSSKRKAHILKNHPGLQVPPSCRKKPAGGLEGGVATVGAASSLGQSFSHAVGSITTMPHGCKFCHKQYASKAKLLQHQRKKHAELVEPPSEKKKVRKLSHQNDYLQITVGDEVCQAVPIAVIANDHNMPATDLLTQAMNEIHSLPGEVTLTPRFTHGTTPTMVQIQQGAQLQSATIDISQLSAALQSFTSQPGGVTTMLAPPPQPTSPSQAVTVVAPGGSQTINLSNAQFITTRPWTGSYVTSAPFR